ncbi:MAG: hypothetical protein ACOC3C_07070 [Candidatus Thorarchaeota archaeon]
MYIIPEYKFAFLAAPRTGSKAIATALQEYRGAELIGSHHTTPDEHPEIEIDGSWTVCSTIRNHWDAMISWWFKIERKARAMTPLSKFLPRFCENNPNFVQNGQLWWRTLPHTNTILRHEWLQADFDQALVKVGMSPLDLPRITDSHRDNPAYQVYYKRATARWVGLYFAEEIKHCGYKF